MVSSLSTTDILQTYMTEMIQDRRSVGSSDSRDLFSNLIRAIDEDANSGLTMQEVMGSESSGLTTLYWWCDLTCHLSCTDVYVFLLAGHEVGYFPRLAPTAWLIQSTPDVRSFPGVHVRPPRIIPR